MKVELDKPRFSTSAVDAAGFLSQLGNFWKNLEWPVAADAMGLLSVLFEVKFKRCKELESKELVLLLKLPMIHKQVYITVQF